MPLYSKVLHPAMTPLAIFRKVVASLLAGVLILSSVPPTQALPTSPFSAWPKLPTALGSMTDHFSSTASALPQLILIQDLHSSPAVQKRISRLLGYLDEKLSSEMSVTVEGATGVVDSAYLATATNRAARQRTADFLLKNLDITRLRTANHNSYSEWMTLFSIDLTGTFLPNLTRRGNACKQP
jgi:hypothetical protein